jgi:sulfonate transport system permease protein
MRRPSAFRETWKALVFPASLIVLWFVIVRFYHPTSEAFVDPLKLATRFVSDSTSGFLIGAILSTIMRAVTGFLIGASAGLFVGLAIGLSCKTHALLSPSIDSLRQVALFGWIPLLSAWLGNGEAMKLALIALGAFFPVALAAAAGCANVSRSYRDLGRALELRRWTEITKIILPAAAPSIVSGLELGLNISWLGTIGAEYLIGTGYINGMGNGLGDYLAQAREFAQMDRVIIGVVALGVIGLALDRIVSHLSRRILVWQTQ